MALNTLNDLFEEQIKDLFSAENQLLKALPKMAKASTDGMLRQAFETHLEQTREHAERLKDVAEMCDFTLKEVSTLPRFDVPPGFTIESYFEKVTRDGFADRRCRLGPLAASGRLRYPIANYEERLEKEI